MTQKSLAAFLAEYQSPVQALRELPRYSTTYPGLAAQYSNWRSEQKAWREDVALLDQSFHMANLFVDGPDAVKVFADLAINRFDNFRPGMAKQFIATNPDGQLLGDGILVYLGENSLNLVGEPRSIISWVEYNLEKGDYDVTYEFETSAQRQDQPPRYYRYQIQGPKATALIEEVSGGPAPETKFFHLADFTIAGKRTRGIRHGMAGQAGFEFFGPWEDGPAVREAFLAAGEKYGLKVVGSTAYFTNNIESGWLASPLPALYSGESTREFREWLPASAAGSLGGSFDAPDIEDYYVTPFDVGYGRFIASDHDFVGREALTRLSEKPSRQKVTLIWNEDDVAKLVHDLLAPESGLPPQYLEFASAKYVKYLFDRISVEDQTVGFLTHTTYLAHDRRLASLGLVDAAHAEPGTKVVITWGDSLATPRNDVEPHQQVQIRATVAPVPFSAYARETYRK
ncbi:aminomethyl transferase family protein [Microbacterium sp. 18062]|uniref:aminomethyl transferase family protein n=1 Tax=Microbacterium sp. 18062 TaxID=2681410 RepID=UPI00135A6855|nr:aminomethyl transferase family protein [Microbacterium sp. 18062]